MLYHPNFARRPAKNSHSEIIHRVTGPLGILAATPVVFFGMLAVFICTVTAVVLSGHLIRARMEHRELRGDPALERAFPPEALLLDVAEFPIGWKLDRIYSDDYGWFDDTEYQRGVAAAYYYVGAVVEDDSLSQALEVVNRFEYAGWASFQLKRQWNTIESGPPAELEFTPQHTDEWRLGCDVQRYGDYVCEYVAAYEEFLVLMHFTVSEEGHPDVTYITYQEMADVLEAVDQHIGQMLNE